MSIANATNEFDYASLYTEILDRVYKNEAVTNVLDTNGSIVSFLDGSKTFKVPKIDVSGLGEYSRTAGYPNGAVTVDWEVKAPNYDRGIKLIIDRQDDNETLDIPFANAASELQRTKAIPEMDAFRFATYAGTTGISTKQESISTAEAFLDAVLAAWTAMDEAEVPAEGRYLFAIPTLMNSLWTLDSYKSRIVIDNFGSNAYKVPQNRFYTAIDLFDGRTAGELAGGYKKATAGKNINFMIISKPSVIQAVKHQKLKFTHADNNKDIDAHEFASRTYAIAATYDNKLKGIHCSYSTT